jgi:hypothetical protein
MDRVSALCATRKLILIGLVPHSSHLSQPLDLCVFALFKILYKKERQGKGIKGETRKIDRALLALYKRTIIPMVRWSLATAGFHLSPSDLLGAVTVDPTPFLNALMPHHFLSTMPSYIRSDCLPNGGSNQSTGSDSGFQGRRSLRSISLPTLTRQLRTVLYVAIKRMRRPLMRKATTKIIFLIK